LLRFAIIENDEVVNVIVADAEFIKYSKIKATQCGDQVCPGWKYVGKEFIAPEPNYAPEVIDETIPE
jgi:hypothetical protein